LTCLAAATCDQTYCKRRTEELTPVGLCRRGAENVRRRGDNVSLKINGAILCSLPAATRSEQRRYPCLNPQCSEAIRTTELEVRPDVTWSISRELFGLRRRGGGISFFLLSTFYHVATVLIWPDRAASGPFKTVLGAQLYIQTKLFKCQWCIRSTCPCIRSCSCSVRNLATPM